MDQNVSIGYESYCDGKREHEILEFYAFCSSIPILIAGIFNHLFLVRDENKAPIRNHNQYLFILSIQSSSQIDFYSILQLSILRQRIPIDRSIKTFLRVNNVAQLTQCWINLCKLPVTSCLGYGKAAKAINGIYWFISGQNDEFFICQIISFLHYGVGAVDVIFTSLSNICR